MSMSVDSELEGTFSIYQRIVWGPYDYSGDYDYALTAQSAGGDFEVSVPDYYDLQLTCSVSGSEMTCEGTDEDAAEYVIEYEAQ